MDSDQQPESKEKERDLEGFMSLTTPWKVLGWLL